MYETPEEKEWRQETIRKHERYFQLASSFVTLAERLEDEFARKRITREQLALRGLALSFLLAKSHKTALAVLMLCERGYVEDSLLLTRAIFEAALWARYIAKDRENAEERARAYFRYDTIERHNKLKKLVDECETEDPLRAKLEEALPNLEENLPKTKEEYEHVCRLGKRKISQLAEETKLTHLLYDSFYRQSSEYVHSRGRSANSYIRDDDGHVDILIVPTDEGLPDLIIHLCLFLWYLTDRFNFLFELGAEDILNQEWRKVEDACRRRGSEPSSDVTD